MLERTNFARLRRLPKEGLDLFVAVSMVIAYRLRSATPISSASIGYQFETAFKQLIVDIDRCLFDTFELQRRDDQLPDLVLETIR